MKTFKYALLILVAIVFIMPVTSQAAFWWPFINSDNSQARIGDKVEKVRETKTLPSRSPKASVSVRPTPDAACAQSTVQARENAIIAALDTFSSSVKASLQVRSSALVSAWDLSNAQDRNVAIRTASLDYNTSARAAAKTFKLAHKDAWKAYRTGLKTCTVQSAPIEGENSDIPAIE